MRSVGVRDLRDHATRYLAGDEVLAIERHGQPIGFYIPTGASRQESFAQALERLELAVRQLVEAGISEDELSSLYDLRESVPERESARSARPSARSSAARR